MTFLTLFRVRFKGAFPQKIEANQRDFEMTQTSEKFPEEPATEAKTDPWQRFAREVLQDAVAQRAMNSRELAELLSEYGVEVEPKTLSRRINRGTFDAGFFLLCLSALGAEKVDILGDGLVEVHVKPERVWRRSRLKS
ncbi:DUF6471 domain-containing protein [Acidovorax sp. SRB_24]|uniref:DUF6471 domain-containing protein n=1 Tax=Acidovorax sp. SRB_24 TaxID=1962700 RepID=UPI00145CA9A3